MSGRNEELKLPIMQISNFRINSDGPGIRTLVLTEKCPLKCKYCINNICHDFPKEKLHILSSKELYYMVKHQRIYYWASGGGIVFGGGEPLLYENFIIEFARKYAREIPITIETSLNISINNIEELKKLVGLFIVDIKDMNADIYYKYTGMDNSLVLKNLHSLKEIQEKIILRIPKIPEINTDEDRKSSWNVLKEMGYSRFDYFCYSIHD